MSTQSVAHIFLSASNATINYQKNYQFEITHITNFWPSLVITARLRNNEGVEKHAVQPG